MIAQAREDVYRAYWWFAAERQRIFLQRMGGAPKPWTDDSILQSYKFCNTFRASDRISQFLIRNVAYGEDTTAEDLLLRIVLFRLFSREATWRALEEEFGSIRVSSFDFARADQRLEAELSAGRPIYTHAFILCANKAFGHQRKHRNHLALIESMLREHSLFTQLARARTMRGVYETLLSFPLLGPFMSYQLTIDLNYSEVFDFSENDFTVAGPGSHRGIRKVFSDLRGHSDEDVIQWMVANQQAECSRLDIKAPALFGRPLHAIDCQSLFCEVDKYSRLAFPELKSNRTRIKATFVPAQEPVKLFYPPKWKLNNKIPENARWDFGEAA